MATQNSAGRIDSHDVEEHIQIVKPWEMILRQMSPGPFHGRIEYLQVNGMLVYREHWTRRILGNGATPEGYFMFGSSLAPANHIDWCGADINPRHLGYARPSSEIDFVTPDDNDHAVLLVPCDLMRYYFGEESIEAALSSHRHHLEYCEQRDCNLIARMNRMISKYLRHPELLADARECKAIESQLLQDVAEVFPYGSTDAHGTTPSRRRQAFRRAIEISEGLKEPITVPDYASATGVSQRTLELTFQERLGISPRRYLRWHRMQNVHRELRTKDADSASVTEVAAHWGFSELGRFAVEYKRLFDVSPSVTLRNRNTSTPKRILDLLP